MRSHLLDVQNLEGIIQQQQKKTICIHLHPSIQDVDELEKF